MARLQITADILQARRKLQTLDLIDASGQPTSILEAIKLAPEAEYKARLGEWLQGAYADILAHVDPATADDGALHDAFGNYNPAGQRVRMVTLFQGLFRAAGIMADKAGGAPRKKAAMGRVSWRLPQPKARQLRRRPSPRNPNAPRQPADARRGVDEGGARRLHDHVRRVRGFCISAGGGEEKG